MLQPGAFRIRLTCQQEAERLFRIYSMTGDVTLF